MPDQKTISIDEVNRILDVEEGHFLDLKRVEVSPGKLSESISAFANTAGGELFVGIGEQSDKRIRFWKGFDTMEEANALFQVIESMSPLGNHIDATFLRSPGRVGQVLHLVVQKTQDIIRASDGHPYVRRNAQNLKVIGDEAMRRLSLDKGIITFENEAVNIPMDAVANSEVILNFILEVVPNAEPDDWLRKQHLIVNGRPIVAATLLFSDEPQAALPKRSAIKIYRYQTRTDEGTREQLAFDPITIEGCLYRQITEAVARTKQIVEGIRTLTEKGLEPVIYPDETLHEIITNAVLHRDYSIAADVHVRVYDNRIEIESPGRLPGHVTTENILREQSARNPKVVRLINKFPNPPNKDVGEGLNTAFDAMKRLRLKEPEIVESEHSVIVHIRHTPLASPQEAVMSYLENNAEITNRIARDLTGIRSENSMKNVFLSLKDRGLIEPVPGKEIGGRAAWRKVERKESEIREDETSRKLE